MQSVLSLLGNEWVRDGIIVLGGYTLGRVGLTTAYSDVKATYSWVRSKL